jgi:hypothetical protein
MRLADIAVLSLLKSVLTELPPCDPPVPVQLKKLVEEWVGPLWKIEQTLV